MIDITGLLEQFGLDPTLLLNWMTFVVLVLVSSLFGYQAMKITDALKSALAKWLGDQHVPILSIGVSMFIALMALILLVPLVTEFTILQGIAFVILAGANIDQKSSQHFQVQKLLGNAQGLSDIKKRIEEDES